MKTNNKITLAVCMALSISACSPKMTTEQYLAQAKEFSEKRDHSSAIIALKNAVKLNVKDPNVRYALGAAYLTQGNYFSAEKELEKAEELGSDNETLASELVQVKVKLNKFDYVYKIAEQSGSYSSAEQVIILTYAGIASIHQGKPEQAKEYIEQAISISDDSVYGNIGRAYLSHSGNNFQHGLATVDELLSGTPDFAEAILLKGYLLQASKQFDAAAKTFEQYSKLRPKDIQAIFFIAQNYVYAQSFDVAEPYVDLLLKMFEFNPLANQLKAEIEYSRESFKLAKDHAVTSFQQNDSFKLSKIIAGMSAYKLGDYEQSYQYLVSVKDILPPEHLIRKIIIDLQLKLGYDTEAVSELQLLADLDAADPAMLTMASNRMLASGNIEAAQELLESSIALETATPRELAKQGVTQLRLNQTGQGIERLEEALKLDPELAFAEQGLAIGYIGNKQYVKALNIAKKWQQEDEKKVQGFLLEGLVLDKQKKKSEAQVLLNKVLALDNNNIAALYRLAAYAHQDKNIELAFDYYTQVLKQQPHHIRAIINLVRLSSATPEQKNDLIEKAVKFYQLELSTKPENSYLKLGLAYLYKLDQNYETALELLQEIANSNKPIVGVDIVIGDTYKAQGDWQAAIKAYQKFVSATNYKDLRATQKLITTLEHTGELNTALLQTDKALEVNQDNVGLLLLKIYYQSILKIEPKQSELAKIKVNKITANHWLLDKALGLIAYNHKNFSASIKHFADAYNKNANGSNAIHWSKSVALNGDKKKSLEILENHLENLAEVHSAITVKLVLAEEYINNSDFSKALVMYENILEADPENIIALNNLSYLELKGGNIKKSLAYAEQAVAIKGNNAAIIDTYAQVLVANKQFKLAIEQYDKVLSLNDTNVEVIINKAEALINNDQSDLAKPLLTSLKTDNEQEKARIKKLLNDL